MNDEAWLSLSAKILSDVKEWRKAHPKATFVEIEDEVHRRMMQLEAHVLRDAAQASASRVWGQGASEAPPNCRPARCRSRRAASLSEPCKAMGESLSP